MMFQCTDDRDIAVGELDIGRLGTFEARAFEHVCIVSILVMHVRPTYVENAMYASSGNSCRIVDESYDRLYQTIECRG